ncbi:MerR family transcriptional regulator [Merdimmobilis hominis]|jgi:DNA-binding transcriptional MerR regulator|uniref:HTH-type transcriptional regulator CueR n=1 Tax=uncultured Anaerotruncus sp. TaxID=905011 RepID=A0A6N2SKY0_9FIRM|nr:MerR family transcriptional regulator [Merdimmobilis hominis]MCD4836199.1 MerR family transcriptional regulator [Merdimmobilis hominis]PWL64038.1 MAG: MerR family transcriptional regulator [Oscillospiraceae bacterium]
MKINEICQKTGLTKKAVAYYQEKGLISPASQENGYREFTQEEAGRLGTIAFLRRLGLPVQEIALLLASPGDAGATKLVQARQEDRLALQKKQLELLNRYLDGESPEALERQLEFLEQKQTIRQKLLGAFPGYYGRYISIHFGRFLQSPIETPEQRDAYEQILTFLDGVEFPPLTPGCQALLEQAETQAGDRELAAQPQRMEETMADFDAFWEENQKPVLEYLQWKQSEEFQQSAMGEWMALFREFGKSSGYYDVFLPQMRRLSPAYEAYSRRLEEANQKLLEKLPPDLAKTLLEE